MLTQKMNANRNGGAKMSVRNLRIREDTAKYLLNLDVNSAYYDPKDALDARGAAARGGNARQGTDFVPYNKMKNTGDARAACRASAVRVRGVRQGAEPAPPGRPDDARDDEQDLPREEGDAQERQGQQGARKVRRAGAPAAAPRGAALCADGGVRRVHALGRSRPGRRRRWCAPSTRRTCTNTTTRAYGAPSSTATFRLGLCRRPRHDAQRVWHGRGRQARAHARQSPTRRAAASTAVQASRTMPSSRVEQGAAAVAALASASSSAIPQTQMFGTGEALEGAVLDVNRESSS